MRISDWSSDVCSSDLWPSSIIWSLPRPATPAGRTFPSCCASCAASSTRRSLEHQGQETITMSLAVAIPLDPLEAIDLPGDTSFLLALEAQPRGPALFHYLQTPPSLQTGRVSLPIHPPA